MIKNVYCAGIPVAIVDDGATYRYGTKQRVIKQYLEHLMQQGFTEFVYVGPTDAMGAYALAGAVDELSGATCKLFLCGRLPNRAKSFSNKINIKVVRGDMQAAERMANSCMSDNTYKVSFGINDEVYIDMLYHHIAADSVATLKPKSVWLACGSGTLLKVLLRVYPDATFYCVIPGICCIWEDLFASDWHRIVVVRIDRKKYPFAKASPTKAPYNSLSNYDEKTWWQMKEYIIAGKFKGNALIWNVAGNI